MVWVILYIVEHKGSTPPNEGKENKSARGDGAAAESLSFILGAPTMQLASSSKWAHAFTPKREPNARKNT